MIATRSDYITKELMSIHKILQLDSLQVKFIGECTADCFQSFLTQGSLRKPEMIAMVARMRSQLHYLNTD